MTRRPWVTPVGTARAVVHEIAGAARLAADGRSFARHVADVMLYRIMRVTKLPRGNRERTLRFKGGVEIVYRLNRGDIQGLREVWVDEVYRLPFTFEPKVVVDLGANIGLTSVFLASRYRCTNIIAVEPDPSNAHLTRVNLAANNIVAEVIEAAVGPEDGVAKFASHGESNLGHLGGTGRAVQVLSMESILARTPGGVADLVKMDIEGGEEALLDGDVSWLGRVGALIVEFHPTVVDYPRLVEQLKRAGFRYVSANSAWPGSMDAFVRDGWSSSR